MPALSVTFGETVTPHVRGRGTRYRLTVLANDEMEVVCAAGGLLVDRTMTGWDVVVYLADLRCQRPLRILGVTADDVEPVEAFDTAHGCSDAIVVSAGLYRRNHAIRRRLAVSTTDRTEVAVWGGDWPAELGH